MKREDVPQHRARAFMGHAKVLYAEDEHGRLVRADSNGWEAEEIVLDQALEEIERHARDAWLRARQGKASALEYHMYRERMDVTLLAQSTGYHKWRVRRDLRPGAFAKLGAARRMRYAEALGKSPKQLDQLPDQP